LTKSQLALVEQNARKNFALVEEKRYRSPMNDRIDREALRQWLKESGQSREWLATQCGVAKATVDSWLSTRPIAKTVIPTLRRLMGNAPELAFKLTLQEWEEIRSAAAAEGMTPMTWISKAIKQSLK
jgi:hypothetical protein